MRASSRKAWTDWKGRLLGELFERTSELLETGSADPGRAIELIEARVETRREAAAAELREAGFAESDVATYFEMMPRRYFTAHSPRQIARHAQVVLGLGKDELMATAIRELRGGFSEFIVCTRDVHGLYANVAGTLTANDINILASNVYTTRTGLALETYRVGTPPGGDDERRMAWDQLRSSLAAVLRGERDVRQMLGKRRLRVGGPRSLSRRPPAVSITNEESDFYTIVDVTADDRLGLLDDLTRTIAEHDYEIYISKAASITDQVTDTFYLKDREGKKLHDPAAIERLRADLRAAAEVPEEARPG
jgi:[protein-PII] uridylyltransferase